MKTAVRFFKQSSFIKYFLILTLSLTAFASVSHSASEVAQTFTVDGRLYQSTAVAAPVLLASGVIKAAVLSPDAFCILYEENQTFNTTTTDGYFSVLVGSATGAAKRTASDSGNGMATVFSNTIIAGINGKQSSDGSTNCTYTPVAGDKRLLRVKVTPVSDGITRTLSPDLMMNSAPSAIVAERAESLQGISASSFLQLGSGSTTQSNIDNVFSVTNYPRLTDLLSVGTGSYVRESTNGAALAPVVSGDAVTPAAGEFWYDSSANILKYYNGTAVKSVGAVSSASDLTSGTIGGTVAINSTGNIATTGTISGSLLRMADQQGTPKYIEFKAPASIGVSNLTYTWPAAFPGANMVLQSDTSGTLSWVVASSGAGDLKSDGSVAMSADWDLNGATVGGTRKIFGLADPSATDGAATKAYVDSSISTAGGSFIKKDGSVAYTSNQSMGGNTLYGNSTASGNLLLESTSNGSKGSIIIQPNGGNVGIGLTPVNEKLEVNGAVKIGTSAAMTAGTLRWTGTNFQGSDGISWFNIMPNPPAAGGCDQTQTFNTPGTYGYTAPASYATITVKVWGGGGAGGYFFGNGSTSGGTSTVSSLGLSAGGGGPGTRDLTNTGGVFYGLGGSGSGGTVNTSGGNGVNGTWATVGGAGGNSPAGGGGGSGTATGAGANGGNPGGGGGGGQPDPGTGAVPAGGGAGGYSEKTFTPITLPPGSTINDIVIAAGGNSYPSHPAKGGEGGSGQISITCSTTGTPASVGWGSCSIAAFAATSGSNSRTCTGVVAGSPVYCSPTAAPGTATVVWGARASAADTVDINLSANFTTSTAWKCMFMNP